MPRPVVATPEQTARARAEVGSVQPGSTGPMPQNRILGVRGLRKAERRMLEKGGPEIYIYNVSPIWSWKRPIAGRGDVMIPVRKKGDKISQPLVIPNVIVRDYDAGNRTRQMYTEEGQDVAEDILCCSTEMPGMPQNDLTGYGCFYLVGTKFEDLAKDEAEEIFGTADAKHEAKCREWVMNGDQLADNDITRRWITPVFRMCAVFLAERGDRSMYERRWVSVRGQEHRPKVEECRWCGTENKPGLVLCPNCKNVLDDARFAAMSKKAAKQEPASA